MFFDIISKSNVWTTQFQKFRCLRKNLLILRPRKVELLYLHWSGDWNRIYCFVTSVCVFRFVYTLPLTRNSEVKKVSSDSESNSFANLSRISDNNILEEDQEDVKESLTHKLTSRVDVAWHFYRAIQMPFSCKLCALVKSTIFIVGNSNFEIVYSKRYIFIKNKTQTAVINILNLHIMTWRFVCTLHTFSKVTVEI